MEKALDENISLMNFTSYSRCLVLDHCTDGWSFRLLRSFTDDKHSESNSKVRTFTGSELDVHM